MSSWNNLYKNLSEELSSGLKTVIVTELDRQPNSLAVFNKFLFSESELRAETVSEERHHKLAKPPSSKESCSFLMTKRAGCFLLNPSFPKRGLSFWAAVTLRNLLSSLPQSADFRLRLWMTALHLPIPSVFHSLSQ